MLALDIFFLARAKSEFLKRAGLIVTDALPGVSRLQPWKRTFATKQQPSLGLPLWCRESGSVHQVWAAVVARLSPVAAR